jgi:CAAX prenyl protease-like protein
VNDSPASDTLTPANRRHFNERAVMAHALPFVVWLMLPLMMTGPLSWRYALKSIGVLALLVYFRPWRWYARLVPRHLPMAVLAGALVFVVWVVPESAWMARHAPAFREWYLRYAVGITSFGKLPAPLESTPYAPEVCGWALAAMRVLGSAGVIAIAEEFFWRGMLYRALQDHDFLHVDLGRFDLPRFLLVAVLFGVEHQRWAVGIIAGLVYGALMIRGRNIWPAITAHIVTNLLLGMYVLATGSYQFWGT